MRATSLMVEPSVQGGSDFRQGGPLARAIEPAGPKVLRFEIPTSGDATAFSGLSDSRRGRGRQGKGKSYLLIRDEPSRGRGKRLPSTLEALARRDELIRTARAQFFASLSEREAAVRIAASIGRYASTAWTRERLADTVPQRHVGKVTAIWWQLLSVHDHAPSAETVRRALRGGRVYS
jgi:hypothetical protein